MLSRPLIDFDSLPAVLAHELGHLNTLDGRLTAALDRLCLLDDPLADRDDDLSGEPQASFLWSAMRWTIRLAAGGTARLLLAPLWAAFWRSREYAADRYAAALGYGEDLAEHLADFEQPLDLAGPTLPFNRSEHPPIALRIERLRAIPELAVSK